MIEMEGRVSKDAWLEESRRLLDVEWQAENDMAVQELDAAPRRLLEILGKAVTFLEIDAFKTGLYGKTIAVFVSSKGRLVNGNSLSVGDIVRVVPNQGAAAAGKEKNGVEEFPSGIVSRVSEEAIEVAFRESTDDQSLSQMQDLSPLRLEKLPNDDTHRKQLRILDELEHISSASSGFHVSQVLFGESQPLQHLKLPDGAEEISPFNPGLNEPQLEAINFALRSRDVSLIHGPPGTGKTTAVVELIRQAVEVYGLKVLVCAPSNVAVDNIILRLSPFAHGGSSGGKTKSAKRVGADGSVSKVDLMPMKIVRVGHPARLLPQVLQHSLDAVISKADGTEIVRDVRTELQDIVKKLGRPWKKSKKESGGRKKPTEKLNFREMRERSRELRQELRTREKGVVQSILKGCNVVLATNAGAAGIGKLMGFRSNGDVPEEAAFDLVIIDEAAQAIEASCWIPILLGKRLVLAGDHKQLPPTIKSEVAAKGILGVTLFDRVVGLYGSSVVKLLSIQYRMHQLINDWASTEMYEGKLIADESVARRKLVDLEHVQKHESSGEENEDEEASFATLVLIDTAFCGLEEAVEGEDERGDEVSFQLPNAEMSGSKFNQGEAQIVKKHLEELFAIGLEEHEVAVITPYNAQVHLLRSLLSEKYPRLEIRSVDGFQGREKEAVVLSLVRSNPYGNVGFLSDDRRLNVAITRARRHVCVVCDSHTLSSNDEDSFLSRMVNYFNEHAVVLAANEYDESIATGGYTPAPTRPNHFPQKQGNGKQVERRKNEKKPPKERKQPLSEEEKGKLLSQIDAFQKDDGATVLNFPCTLSPAERHAVHELAEDLGLGHQSIGEGTERFIQVLKQASKIADASRKACDERANDVLEKPSASSDHEINDSIKDEVSAGGDAEIIEGDGNGSIEEEAESEEEQSEEFNDTEEAAQPEARSPNQTRIVDSEEENKKKAFAKEFLPKKYMELVASGMPANVACVRAVEETEKAYKLSTMGGDLSDLTKEDSQPAPAPAPTPNHPPTQSRPKTELEKIRELQAKRYAEKKAQEAQQWLNSSPEVGNKKPSSRAKPKSQGHSLGGGQSAESSNQPRSKLDKILSTEDEDLAMLDNLVKASKFCAFDKCKESVQTIGATCNFCKLRFCFKHMQEEVHGCGAAVRASSRQQFRETSAASASTTKQLKPHQREYLRRELGKKIAGATGERSAKSTQGDSNKKSTKKGKR